MNKELKALGNIIYKNNSFKIYWNKNTDKKIAIMENNHQEKEKMEQLVTKLINNHDGRGYKKKRLSIKKLIFFGGILSLLTKPNILAKANNFQTIESVNMNDNLSSLEELSKDIETSLEINLKEERLNELAHIALINLQTVKDAKKVTMSDKNTYNEELAGTEVILYGKKEVDDLFTNKRISKKGVLKILEENKNIPNQYKSLFTEYINDVYQKEENPDMRIYALNLSHLKFFFEQDQKMSYYDPTNNEMVIHRIGNKELFAHENYHMRNLVQTKVCVDNNIQKIITVTGNSCINDYRGSGLREAYTVARNKRYGNNDTDYELLLVHDEILHCLFPKEIIEIEDYNNYEKLKSLFLTYGQSEESFNQYIAITDVIGKSYQENLGLEENLIRQSFIPLIEIMNYMSNLFGYDNEAYANYCFENVSSNWQFYLKKCVFDTLENKNEITR